MGHYGVHMELLMLPDELLHHIVASIEDTPTLCEVAAGCRRLNSLAEPFLYRSIIISDGSQAVALAKAIASRPVRASYVRKLLVSTKFEKAPGINQLPSSLSRMENLQDLSLETPDCNMKKPGERVPWIMLQDRYERIFQHSSLLLPPGSRNLPRLRSCTSKYSIGTPQYWLFIFVDSLTHGNQQALYILSMTLRSYAHYQNMLRFSFIEH